MPSETTPSEQGDKPPQVSGVMPEGLPETFHARVRPVSGPLMMSCTIEQNRQILVATAQEQLPVPELPASCETALALAQTGATGQ